MGFESMFKYLRSLLWRGAKAENSFLYVWTLENICKLKNEELSSRRLTPMNKVHEVKLNLRNCLDENSCGAKSALNWTNIVECREDVCFCADGFDIHVLYFCLICFKCIPAYHLTFDPYAVG